MHADKIDVYSGLLREVAIGTVSRHPFGEALLRHRLRKPGLSQTRLAQLTGYDQAILVRMCKGGKDLTGPSGRDRVLRLIDTLADEGVLATVDEANALLLAAAMPPLFDRQPAEAQLLGRLRAHAVGVQHGNLPAPLNAFVGRQAELAELQRLLEMHRLVTVTGAGGMGKTRLSLRLCADLQSRYADGVWLIELAAAAEPAHVEEAVANALGVAVAGRSALDAVIGHLRHRHVLLLFDNCEHVVDAAAHSIQRLLKSCAHLRIFATSRAVLDIDGEAIWRLPALSAADATELFIERVRARNPDVELDEHVTAVAQVCQQLDGMPLAIELVASRAGALSLPDMAARLEDRLAVLTLGRRGAVRRQQTLWATIDWSHDLLTDRERLLLARLSVFAGGWTLKLAEDVVSDREHLPSAAVASVLGRLVDQSLVVADVAAGAARYRMLESIRTYAAEHLNRDALATSLLRRHAEALTALAEASFPAVLGRDQRLWLTSLRAESANWRKALTWCLEERGDVLLGLRLIWRLTFFWHAASDYELEARHWIGLAKQADLESHSALAQARLWAAGLLFERLPPSEQVMHSQHALRLFEQTGDV